MKLRELVEAQGADLEAEVFLLTTEGTEMAVGFRYVYIPEKGVIRLVISNAMWRFDVETGALS